MVTDNMQTIIQEISAISKKIDNSSLNEAVVRILSAKRVFTAGAGRAGAMMQCMTKRLMHIGLDAYVVGDTITPPAGKGDLLVMGSGSGETESLVVLAQKAKGLGVQLLLITTNPKSTIAESSDFVLVIPAGTPKSAAHGSAAVSVQPMANLFEQMLLICGDAICIEVAREKGMDDDSMFARHANLE